MFKQICLSGLLGLVLLGGFTTTSFAAPNDDPCKGIKKADRPPECDGEETPGGEHRSLTVIFDDLDEDSIQSDGSAAYSDSEKSVNAELGGQAQPNRPGFKVGLSRKGKDFREITADIECTALPGGLNNCNLLPNGGTTAVTDHTMALRLRPYEINCPEPLPDGECPDVFTMGTGSENAEEMSFRMNYWNQEIFIEIASGDGGGGSLSPGRCLSLLSEYELGEFLGLCGTNNCDVDVTAFDGGDLEGAGAGDGESDEWHVDAYMDRALICNGELVYGMTTMTFGLEAIKE